MFYVGKQGSLESLPECSVSWKMVEGVGGEERQETEKGTRASNAEWET